MDCISNDGWNEANCRGMACCDVGLYDGFLVYAEYRPEIGVGPYQTIPQHLVPESGCRFCMLFVWFNY